MTTPSLRDAQVWMKSRIRPQPSEVSPGGEASLLEAQRGTPGEERVAVYAGGYVIRIREALAEAYEAVRHVLGEEMFAELAQAYAHLPSRDYNLSFAGRQLPEFLEGWPATRDLPFLPDLARLEWRVVQAFHAFEEPPLAFSDGASPSLDAWERSRLVFQPSVSVMASRWPILDIWEARTIPREQISIDLVDRPQRIVVYREGPRVRCESISPTQYLVLERLLAGDSVGMVCEAAAGEAGDEAAAVAGWFSHWVRSGLIVRMA